MLLWCQRLLMLLLLYMRISGWPKKATLFSLLLIFSLSLISGLVPARIQTASADSGLDSLCVLPLSSGRPNGWLKLEFVNRATIRLTFTPGSKKCDNDKNRSIQYLTNDSKQFGTFIEGDYTDEDTAHGGLNYIKSDGSSSDDDSVIDEFKVTSALNDAFGGRDNVLSDAELAELVKPAEYLIALEENTVGSTGVNCTETHDNFVFHKDGSNYKWDCYSNHVSDSTTGVLVGVTITNLAAFNITYNWNGSTIEHVSPDEQDTRTFSPCASGEFGADCNSSDYLYIADQSGKPVKQADLDVIKDYGDFLLRKKGSSSKGTPIRIAGKASQSATQTGSTANGNGGLGEDSTQVRCEDGEGILDGMISWMLCPLVYGAQGIVNTVGGWVVDQLEFDVDAYLTKPDDKTHTLPVKNAWNAFRIIALALLIAVALVGILLGSFIDAYTIKKVLPRMLIAIIGISLSWDIMILIINVTNASGTAVRALIDSPFRSMGPATINPSLILVGGGVASALTTVLGLLSFVGTAALAVLFAFVFTILRIAAIIAFVIFAPVAILAWILPGTNKLWNFWQTGLAGALLMFPIVAAFLSIGAAFGKIIYFADTNSGLNQAMSLIATYAPYFLIPKAFSMAGGVIGNLSGMVNDRGRGAFDRLKKFRQDQGEKRRHDIQAGKFFKGGNEGNWRGRVNRGAQRATFVGKAGFNPLKPTPTNFRKWADNINRNVGEHEAHHSEEIMKSTQGRILQDDDIASAIIESGGDMKKFRGILEERAYERFGGADNARAMQDAIWGAEQLQREFGYGGTRLAALRSKFNSSTGWNPEYEYERDANGDYVLDETGNRKKVLDADGNAKIVSNSAAGKMLRDINAVAGSNRVLSTQLLAEARAAQSRAGREDTGGAGFSDTALEMDKLWRAQQGIGNYTVEEASDMVTKALIKGKNVHELFRSGKVNVARAVAPRVTEITNDAISSSNANLLKAEADARDTIATINDSTVYTPAEKAERIQKVRVQLAAAKDREEKAVIRAIAQEQMTHAVASASSAEVAKYMGDKVFSQKFDMELPPEVKEKVTAQYDYVPAQRGDPEYIMGKQPQEQPKKRVKVGNRDLASMTRGEVYDRLRNDPTWKAYTKEYGATEAAAGVINPEAAAAVAQDAQAAQDAQQQGGSGPGGAA